MSQKPSDQDSHLQLRAQRVQRIIYIAMAVFIALPFVLAWLTGALRF